MSASVKPRLAGRQPSVRGRGAPGDDQARRARARASRDPEERPLSFDNAAPQIRFRHAGPDDADDVAALHADSWRRHYRGAYADTFLDGDIEADRRAVWRARLAEPAGSETILARRDGRLVGFAHVMFDKDPAWGSLVDNLHVVHDHHRKGLGTSLMSHAARAVAERATSNAMYLWVLEQNTGAQSFYRSCEADCAETATVPPPGGDPARLNGKPRCLRMTWPDVTAFRTPRP